MVKFGWGMRACGTFLLWATAAVALPAQTFTTLFNFNGLNGTVPNGTLVQATNGDLYGTTFYGGADGGGTLFKITTDGTLTTLYNFCSQSGCADGLGPGPLVQGTDGYFYGTTEGGETGSQCGFYGCGTVFKITASGTLTTLYTFNGTDGEDPVAALVHGTDGKFYGTTLFGGTQGAGTVFKITPSGNLTTLYSFCSQSGCTDGEYPAGLIRAPNGELYGTTSNGGINDNCPDGGCGTVFKITPRSLLN